MEFFKRTVRNREEIFPEIEGRQFTRSANAHLSDDKTVAKMGHPGIDVEASALRQGRGPVSPF